MIKRGGALLLLPSFLLVCGLPPALAHPPSLFLSIPPSDAVIEAAAREADTHSDGVSWWVRGFEDRSPPLSCSVLGSRDERRIVTFV